MTEVEYYLHLINAVLSPLERKALVDALNDWPKTWTSPNCENGGI